MVQSDIPKLAEGQILVKVSFMSLDPYMRGRLNAQTTYAAPQELGKVMMGGGVGIVTESLHADVPVGAQVVGTFGWQQFAVVDGKTVLVVAAGKVPPSYYLGVLGMPGATAWYGLHKICAPKAGETLVVSAASGAVGSVVGQLAKALGCRVVGIAGGIEKCAYVVQELGFDACIDYKAFDSSDDGAALLAAIRAECPSGVDCYFENVGGVVCCTFSRQIDFGRLAAVLPSA